MCQSFGTTLWITARIKQKGECKCIPWRNLRDLILAHPDGEKKVDVFALRDNYKKKVKEISQARN
ncbi:hypothetical protein Gotur_025405 [Gossypium turneri]